MRKIAAALFHLQTTRSAIAYSPCQGFDDHPQTPSRRRSAAIRGPQFRGRTRQGADPIAGTASCRAHQCAHSRDPASGSVDVIFASSAISIRADCSIKEWQQAAARLLWRGAWHEAKQFNPKVALRLSRLTTLFGGSRPAQIDQTFMQELTH